LSGGDRPTPTGGVTGTRMICSIAVVCCVAAGCGGGSTGGSGGSAGSTGAPTAPTTTTKPAPTKHEVKSNALWRFLGRVQVIRAPYNRRNDQVNAADRKVLACCTNWAAAASTNRIAAERAKRDADRLAAIVAPAPLEHVYLAYVGAYRTAGLDYGADAAGLRSQAFFQWSSYPVGPVTKFRIALIGYAAANHLTLPHWVHGIGGK
jgi:hypothetical protein